MAHWPRPRARCDRIAALAAGSEHLAVGCNLRGIALRRATDAPRSRTRSAERGPPLGSRRQRRAALLAVSGDLFHGVRCSGARVSGYPPADSCPAFGCAGFATASARRSRRHGEAGSAVTSAGRLAVPFSSPEAAGVRRAALGAPPGCALVRGCPRVLRCVLRVSYRFTKGLRSPHACGSRPPWVGDAWKAPRRVRRAPDVALGLLLLYTAPLAKVLGASLKIFPRKTAELERPVGAQTLPITRWVRKFFRRGRARYLRQTAEGRTPRPRGSGR